MIISDMDCVNAHVNWDITKPEAVEAWKRIRIFIEESCKKPEKKPANKIKPCSNDSCYCYSSAENDGTNCMSYHFEELADRCNDYRE